LSGAATDAAAYASDAASQTAQAVPAVKVKPNTTQTITDTVSGGLNVFSTPSITIGKGGQL